MVHPMFLTRLMPGDPPHSLLSAKQVPHGASHVFNLSHAWWFTTLSVVCKTSATWYILCLSTCPMPGDSLHSLLSAKHQVHQVPTMPSICSHNPWWFTTFLLPEILQVHTSCGFSLCKHNTSSSPHACCQQYGKFIHPVVSACANTTQAVHHMLVASNTASSYILWFQPVQTRHRQLTTCLLPAIRQVHTSCGFSLCNNIQARQFTTCLLPAIQQAPITHNVFSLPRKCCLQVHIITHTTLPASW